jgi:Cu/Ag efflux pump CusA
VFAGQAEAEQTARIELASYIAGTLLLIVLMLFLCFKRPAHPWLVLINLPFSLIGSILAIGLSGIGCRSARWWGLSPSSAWARAIRFFCSPTTSI